MKWNNNILSYGTVLIINGNYYHYKFVTVFLGLPTLGNINHTIDPMK